MNTQEIVCYCSNITKSQIVEALDNGAKTLTDIRKVTGACTKGKCKEFNPSKQCCAPMITTIIEEYEQSKR